MSAAQVDEVMVRFLVGESGVHPDATFGGKPTAVCYAALKQHERMMSYLIRHGASVNITDAMGMTPLHYAVLGGSLVCISLLVANGAALNAQSCNGKTPLGLCQGRPDLCLCTELLQRYGATFKAGPPNPQTLH